MKQFMQERLVESKRREKADMLMVERYIAANGGWDRVNEYVGG
jgi:hypothetical protein